MKVEFNRITPNNFCVGDVLLGNDSNQFEIVEAEKGVATLRKLSPDETNKPECTDGTVTIS